jgi:hypothetical protein
MTEKPPVVAPACAQAVREGSNIRIDDLDMPVTHQLSDQTIHQAHGHPQLFRQASLRDVLVIVQLLQQEQAAEIVSGFLRMRIQGVRELRFAVKTW